MRAFLCLASLAALPPALPAAELTPADLLPPAPAWHGASEALLVPPTHRWITPAEQTGLTDTPSYADTVAWLRRLAAASPWIEVQEFGRTPEGRDLVVVIASRDGAKAVARAKKDGRPTLLAQAGIHAGEIDGKDAGLMLLRDLAVGGKDALLDGANFVFIPVFNADGHERVSEWNRPNQRGPFGQGWRTTAQNLNLNRDYMKAAAPEMQALLRLLRKYDPDLYLDLHVTDGIDYQYDITFGFHGWDGSFAWAPAGAAWLDRTLRPALDQALRAAGHLPGPLIFARNNRDLTAGLDAGPADPRFSSGYGDLRHLPTVLVENHSLKPYKQRVLGTYVLLEASLAALGAHAADLRAARAADDAARPATVAANWGLSYERTVPTDFAGIASEDYDSPASGAREVRWLGTPRAYPGLPVHWNTRPGVELRRPKAYWVPASRKDVIDLLALHGLKRTIYRDPQTVTLEFYRLVDPRPAAQPFEGRHRVTTRVAPEARTVTFPPDSVRIATDQPLGDLAVLLLEPESTDSVFAWGGFPEILQRTEYIEGYVIAPLAERMLAADPKLQAEFAARLAADPAFAANPAARLQWFYERSRFADDRYLLYPVGIER